MTKAELVAALAEFPDDWEVQFDSASSLDNQWPSLHSIGSVYAGTEVVGICTPNPRTLNIIVLDMW